MSVHVLHTYGVVLHCEQEETDVISHCFSVYLCVCVCVSVCVRESERERGGERERVSVSDL